jgi:hypothetical protein
VSWGAKMEGILLSFDTKTKTGKVDTRNDRFGVLTIYFGNVIPANVKKKIL